MALHQLSSAVSETLRRLIPSLSEAEAALLAKCRPVQSKAARPNTHWQCNGALMLGSSQFSRLQQLPAKQFAERVVQDLNLNAPEMMETASVSGPGFITITANRSWLLKQVLNYHVYPEVMLEGPKQKILIDMSSPNIAKRMHVGHIRSTVIGEALSNLFKVQGHEVVKVNHIGDFGSQFGVLMASIRSEKADLDRLDIEDLERLYRLGKQNLARSFQTECRDLALQLQNGNPETLQFWLKIKDISRKDYERLYNKLGISCLIERGESFYAPFLQRTVSELLDRGIAKFSQGAVCVLDESDDFPLIIRKSDGGYTYDTTDLAALNYRFHVEKADRVIYVVDNGQEKHFEKIFAAAKKAGWIPGHAQCNFVGFGVVLGQDGKRFRTRVGGAMPLSELLDEAVLKAKKALIARNFKDHELSLEKTAEAIGISAVKYFDLNRQRDSNISFDLDAMLDFKGNTSVYLQYTRCRAFRIISDPSLAKIISEEDCGDLEQEECDDFERELCVVILGYPDAVNEAVAKLEPHILCNYLYTLASSMNSFYTQCPIIGHVRQSIRVKILRRAVQILEAGFKVLGLTVIDRM